ncbi:phage head closure protein [Flammeovirga sp. OC4]|uniref:phage head closure protein n=1 Tax=Flammeovirga sp. OC4 TaxID=1382345 RepID=UPI0005C4432E|nr:phage head closure protein [Flammeovirga sp. OC4]
MNKIGERNCFITIEKKENSIDENGREVDNWVKFADRWAKVKPKRVNESQQEGQTVSFFVTDFIIDYMFDRQITADMRVLYNGGYFVIVGHYKDPFRKYEVITADTNDSNYED